MWEGRASTPAPGSPPTGRGGKEGGQAGTVRPAHPQPPSLHRNLGKPRRCSNKASWEGAPSGPATPWAAGV